MIQVAATTRAPNSSAGCRSRTRAGCNAHISKTAACRWSRSLWRKTNKYVPWPKTFRSCEAHCNTTPESARILGPLRAFARSRWPLTQPLFQEATVPEKNPTIKVCQSCGKDFQAKYPRQKFCSLSCYWKALEDNIIRKCKTCSRPFRVRPSQIANNCGIYCCRNCWKASLFSVTKNCERCGKNFTVPGSRKTQRYCDRNCFAGSSRPERTKRVKRMCAECGRIFTAHFSVVRPGGAIFCSQACYRQNRKKTPEKRFWLNVNKNGPLPKDASLGPCWIFGLRSRNNWYGTFADADGKNLAHTLILG